MPFVINDKSAAAPGPESKSSLLWEDFLFFSPLQVFGFLEDDVKHFVVILGSIFFPVIFDFFGENRTKQLDFDFWTGLGEETSKVSDNVDCIGHDHWPFVL